MHDPLIVTLYIMKCLQNKLVPAITYIAINVVIPLQIIWDCIQKH